MLKNILRGLMALAMASVLNAGTSAGGNDGRLFGKAYYDIMIENQDTMMEYIEYTNRGGFSVRKFNSLLTGFKENSTISIKTRVLVPNSIQTQRVYVSIGKKYNYVTNISAWTVMDIASYWNDKKQIKEFTQLAVKKDAFGNKYVDYKLEGWFRHDVKGSSINIGAIFKTLRFKMAPVKRGFQNKFVKADIYVLDE